MCFQGLARRHRPGRLLIAVLLCIVSWGSCYYYNLERKLDPENADWLNKVKYIITSKERKLFLDLPAGEKEDFKEEFWARRDPDPQTEENEFKLDYFNRMEQADEMFISEGKPGWLTDRGRIYILFGPPTDRLTYPQGAEGRSQEVWYYGNFPVVFIDRFGSGVYELVTYDLSSLRSFNLMYMHELSQAQARAQQTIVGDVDPFNFDWEVEARYAPPDDVTGLVVISVPYANLWFREEKEAMVTVLDLRLEIRDAENALVWEHETSFDIRIDEATLETDRDAKSREEVPFHLQGVASRLKRSQGRIFAALTNRTGMKTLRKVRVLEFDTIP